MWYCLKAKCFSYFYVKYNSRKDHPGEIWAQLFPCFSCFEDLYGKWDLEALVLWLDLLKSVIIDHLWAFYVKLIRIRLYQFCRLFEPEFYNILFSFIKFYFLFFIEGKHICHSFAYFLAISRHRSIIYTQSSKNGRELYI